MINCNEWTGIIFAGESLWENSSIFLAKSFPNRNHVYIEFSPQKTKIRYRKFPCMIVLREKKDSFKEFNFTYTFLLFFSLNITCNFFEVFQTISNASGRWMIYRNINWYLAKPRLPMGIGRLAEVGRDPVRGQF